MAEINRGGRGRRAPYETTHCRIPTELVPLVQMLSDSYKLAYPNTYSLIAAIGTALAPAGEAKTDCQKEYSKLVNRIRELTEKLGTTGYKKNSASQLIKELTAILDEEI